MKIRYLFIILIFFLATFLRLYRLGQIPNGFDWDEASIGYNAYSILKTGSDEYGKFMPLSFRSFNDYKPPVYFYLTVPSIALFGLNEFAVRLPSAVAGIIAVMAVFYLVEILFKNHKFQLPLAVLSALLLSISPWHLQFSRVAFEANLALTFVILGVLFFLKSQFQKNYIFLSVLFFILAVYSYHSEIIFVPLLVIGLTAIYRQNISKKHYFFALLLAIILALPLIFSLMTGSAGERLNGVSIFPHQTEILQRDLVKIAEDKKNNVILPNLIHNFRLTFAQKIVEGYLSSFNLNWLFIKGDQERHHAPGMGLLYLCELSLLLIGIYYLFHQEKWTRNLLFMWIILAPIPAAPTIDLPHAVRTLTFLPALQIICAYGLISIYSKINSFKITGKAFISIFALLFLCNIFYYFHQYYVHLNVDYAKQWQYGYKELVADVKLRYNNYEKIVVSPKLEQPYIFFLFYLQYDPAEYQSIKINAVEINKQFAKFEFRPIVERSENFNGKTLLIGTPMELSVKHDSIYYPDGTEMAQIVELNHN